MRGIVLERAADAAGIGAVTLADCCGVYNSGARRWRAAIPKQPHADHGLNTKVITCLRFT
jgi:hypothetical protein